MQTQKMVVQFFLGIQINKRGKAVVYESCFTALIAFASVAQKWQFGKRQRLLFLCKRKQMSGIAFRLEKFQAGKNWGNYINATHTNAF